jgi:hypothetical protein
MTPRPENSIIYNKPPLAAVHAGIVTTPPLMYYIAILRWLPTVIVQIKT